MASLILLGLLVAVCAANSEESRVVVFKNGEFLQHDDSVGSPFDKLKSRLARHVESLVQTKVKADTTTSSSAFDDNVAQISVYAIAAFIILFVLFICYVCRKQIRPCVRAVEECCYWAVKSILYPFVVLRAIARCIFYPIKQSCFRWKSQWRQYYHPSEVKI